MPSKVDAAKSRTSEHATSQALVLAPPWLALLLIASAGAVLHARWPQWWAAASIAFCGCLLCAGCWLIDHERSWVSRANLVLTGGWAVGWLVCVTLYGWGTALFPFAVGGITVALANNMRTHHRHRSMGLDLLARLFPDIAEVAGTPGATMRVLGRDKHSKAVKALIVGRPGEHTGADLAGAAARYESGYQMPPGAMTARQSDKARHVAEVVISPPKLIDKCQLWPGPSLPGGSIAAPLRIGNHQTSQPMQLTLLEHIALTGTTGSAKSCGGGWTILAEAITRKDVVIFGMDVTKGLQTLGPFRPALKALITEPEQVQPFLAWVHSQIRPRTDYLAAAGKQKWEEGCGIPAWLVWMEEGPDCLAAMSDSAVERWVSSAKAARSAGIFFAFSCQRPDHSQLPTLARSMFTASLAFGSGNAKDDNICLTERQQQAGCEPALWGKRHPGKCYLDCSETPDDLVGVPGRVFHWGPDAGDPKKLDDSRIKAHVAAYAQRGGEEVMPDDTADRGSNQHSAAPATPVNRPPTVIDGGGQPDGTDPQPTIDALDDPSIPDPGDITRDPGAADWSFDGRPEPEPTPEPAARDQLAELINEWKADGRQRFRAKDLVQFQVDAGLSRSWVQARLAELRARGVLDHDDDKREWIIRDAA